MAKWNSVTDTISKINSNIELDTDVVHLQSDTVEQTCDTFVKDQNVQSSTGVEAQLSSTPQLLNNDSLNFNTQDCPLVKSDESKQKIEEFNTIFNLVCSNNNSTNPSKRNNIVPDNSNNKSVCSAGTFKEFATGVAGKNEKEKPIVPDSSTSENFNMQITALNEKRKNINPITNIKGPPISQILLKAGTVNNPYFQMKKDSSNVSKSDSNIKIKQKPEDQKVTILSDVKVDNAFKSNLDMPPVLKSSTSSPMLQMQTIVINGTPAYKHKQQTVTNFSFTKDEIMAMPTIILVPTSGPPQNSFVTSSQSKTCSTNTTVTKTATTSRLLGPLVIDVMSNNPTPTPSAPNLPDIISQETKCEGLVKTVDATGHGSLPKDSNLVPNKTSTPNAIPPTRKSSSTPRRNSHVRVLDFATPRRILQETINEHDPNQLPTDSTVVTEMNTNGSSEITVHTNIVTSYDKFRKLDSSNKSKNTSTKENKLKSAKKCNWDAELRALALGGTDNNATTSVITPKPKYKKTKKKKVSPVIQIVPDTPEVDNVKSLSLKAKKSKKRIKSVETVGEPIKQTDNPLPEPVDIITECKEKVTEILSTDGNQIKDNTVNDRIDTPENERLSLQNVIGAKLNISDLLETPYKQALYDIQMETPKFLGPDLPDEPISDIKIMSIPTPRFLNTPKPLQATPSSYSSRPTDYSSGGSYYKPDDQDYIPSSEVLQCEVTVVEDANKSTNTEPVLLECKEKENSEKPSRPQRKCTRNVSYKSPSFCKAKEDELLERASVSSETSNKSVKDKKVNKIGDFKSCSKQKTKSDSKKRVIAYKSPHKPKNFMKIKPRRSTPIKESLKKSKKASDTPDNASLKSLSRKKTTSKDKNTNVIPAVIALPTKSRRKSSTPRKLNCTKSFNSENVQKSSNFSISEQEVLSVVKETNAHQLQDSDIEQHPLLWSDDGSQEAKSKEEQPTTISLPEEDDINSIKEYIKTSALPQFVPDNNSEGSLHIDLIKRGFDVETAKIIERELLDTTPIQDTVIQSTSNEEVTVKNIEVSLCVSDKIESDSTRDLSTANNLQIAQEEDDIDEVELSVHECNEESTNFITCQFDETTFVPSNNISKIKDKFSVELCIDDDVTIRLRAGPFTSLFDVSPEEMMNEYNPIETENAVSSICNIDKLYTPMKGRRAQCYEIFDSTLTSIDTPLKADAATEPTYETAEIILEVESIDVKDKAESRKRKRLQSGNLEESFNKKSKPETQYLLNSANIQNIDIESVLSKLHGP